MRNIEIEEAIRRAPEDLDGYEIYADWLLERGEAHGDAILFAIRRKRTERPGVPDLALIAAEARALQNRAHILGPLGELHRDEVECDLELGFVRAARIYASGERAGFALRHGLHHRATAFLRRLGLLAVGRFRPACVNDDRDTARAIWQALFEVGIPPWVEAAALPLLVSDLPAQLDALAGVRHCTFPFRHATALAPHIHRLAALERLDFTVGNDERFSPPKLEAFAELAPLLERIPRIHVAIDLPLRYDTQKLREALPNLTLGWDVT